MDKTISEVIAKIPSSPSGGFLILCSIVLAGFSVYALYSIAKTLANNHKNKE